MARTEIATLGEFGLIQRITQHFEPSKNTIKAVGDDSAVILSDAETSLVSTDLLIEGIHFDLSYTPLKHLGYKAAVVNFSDIAAMNALPQHLLMSIALSNRFSVEAVEEIYEGIRLACQHYSVDLIGGDTTSSEKGLILSGTAIGSSLKENIVYRNGAQIGDCIAVSGNLGAAYIGLHILQREKAVFVENPEMQPEISEENAYPVGRLLKPEARVDMIKFFHKNNLKPNAMMDISDGLSSELIHICTQSGVGAEIVEREIPIAEQVFQEAEKMKLDPTMCALNGGEDYELIFTFPESEREKYLENIDIQVIGKIVSSENGIRMHSNGGNFYDLKAQGWVSF